MATCRFVFCFHIHIFAFSPPYAQSCIFTSKKPTPFSSYDETTQLKLMFLFVSVDIALFFFSSASHYFAIALCNIYCVCLTVGSENKNHQTIKLWWEISNSKWISMDIHSLTHTHTYIAHTHLRNPFLSALFCWFAKFYHLDCEIV